MGFFTLRRFSVWIVNPSGWKGFEMNSVAPSFKPKILSVIFPITVSSKSVEYLLSQSSSGSPREPWSYPVLAWPSRGWPGWFFGYAKVGALRSHLLHGHSVWNFSRRKDLNGLPPIEKLLGFKPWLRLKLKDVVLHVSPKNRRLQ